MKKNENSPFFGDLDEFFINEREINGNLKEEPSKEEANGNIKNNVVDNGDYEYYTEYYDPDSVIENIKKCECGSDSANLMRHSNWCPKFEKWME